MRLSLCASARAVLHCVAAQVLSQDVKFQRKLQERIDGVHDSDDLARSMCRRTMSRGWALKRLGTKALTRNSTAAGASSSGGTPECEAVRERSVVVRLGKSIMGGSGGTSGGSAGSSVPASQRCGDESERSTGGTLRAALLRGAARMELGHSNACLGTAVQEARRSTSDGSGGGGDSAENLQA